MEANWNKSADVNNNSNKIAKLQNHFCTFLECILSNCLKRPGTETDTDHR